MTPTTPMIDRISRALAWASAAAIVILSLVPPSLRPVTGAPHSLEHFAIFALCGFGFGFGYRVVKILEVVALVAFAGLVEVLQLMVPGRHARLTDFAVDAIAGCVGIMIGRAASIIVGQRKRV
jgi:VanZ family protein